MTSTVAGWRSSSELIPYLYKIFHLSEKEVCRAVQCHGTSTNYYLAEYTGFEPAAPVGWKLHQALLGMVLHAQGRALHIFRNWWRRRESNPQQLHCKCDSRPSVHAPPNFYHGFGKVTTGGFASSSTCDVTDASVAVLSTVSQTQPKTCASVRSA